MDKNESIDTPLVYSLYASPRNGDDIEGMSFAIINQEAPPHTFAPEEWEIVRRMIHTAGDFNLMQDVRFSPGAISAGIEALRKAGPIYADSNMIRAGLSLSRLRQASQEYTPASILCHIADPDVARDARQAGLPRSLFAMRKAKHSLNGGVAAFGNSPVALLELNRMIIEEAIRPDLVIAMPVGFVHVEESKTELIKQGIPYIALEGRRGGSTLAVSVIHALCSLAVKAGEGSSAKLKTDNEAIIILGHGSRMPGADEDMEKLAARMLEKLGCGIIETCSMSLRGPYFPEVFDRCVARGATRIIVLPYFLHAGVHMREDIPEMMQTKAAEFPEVKLILGKNLGYDETLVDLVIRRVEESRNLEDILLRNRQDG
jgi:precorrin-8X/cobalt-precorrin-8 methylmutase